MDGGTVTATDLSGAFAKLLKSTISIIMSVCLPVHMELGYHWKDLREI